MRSRRIGLMTDLRILQISSGGDDIAGQDFPLIARGRDGTVVREVANLWKGSWSVGKGVNDIDWGVGGQLLFLAAETRR